MWQFLFHVCQYDIYIFFFIKVNCGNPLDQNQSNNSNIQAIGNSLPALEGDNVTFSCPFGLQINGSNVSICVENGKWEPNPREVECIGTCIFCSMHG